MVEEGKGGGGGVAKSCFTASHHVLTKMAAGVLNFGALSGLRFQLYTRLFGQRIASKTKETMHWRWCAEEDLRTYR